MRLHFDRVDGAGSVESRYYGPYNTLLAYLSGDPAKYEVAPQASTVRVGRDMVDFVLWYVVKDSEDRVVMIVEVKDRSSASSADGRRSADEQMRHRFDVLMGESTTPRVYGISALGTRICIYELDGTTGVVSPPLIGRPSMDRALPRDFLAGRWDTDVLSRESFDALKRVMFDIDAMCLEVQR